MKKTILIVFLLIVGCFKPIEDSTIINKDRLRYLPGSDNPYIGEIFNNYSTGEKEYQGRYEIGLLVEYAYLNRDGSVKILINFQGVMVGTDSVYYIKVTNKTYSGPVFTL